MNFCRTVVAAVFLLLFPVLAACSASRTDGKELIKKAVELTVAACEIYPALTDLDTCVDKVSRNILKSRGVKPERIEEIFREQKIAEEDYVRTMPVDPIRTPEMQTLRVAMIKVIDVIIASCMIEPMISNLDDCFDNAYHAILSSRDPHSGYMNKEELVEATMQMSGSLEGIGAEVALTEDNAIGVVRVMPGSPAEMAGVLGGDRIVAVVNKGDRSPSSSFSTIGAAIKKIRGKPNTKVTLEILRGEKDTFVTTTITRAAVKIEMVETEILAAPNDPKIKYAYVKITQFGYFLRTKMVTALTEILDRNKDVKGIVFDVRGNPGGLLNEVNDAVRVLLARDEVLLSIRDNNGITAYRPVPSGETLPSAGSDITNGLPVAVLINDRSASASEIFAGALKEFDRAVLIGTGTWRKGSIQTIQSLGDGSASKLTEGEYLIGSPTKWVAVQCVGVEPDIAYEAEVAWKPKKESHECDSLGAIVSGGVRSDGGTVKKPLIERDPALYRMGERMLEAVKAFDHVTFVKNEKVRKQLKVPLPKDDPEEESNKK